MSIREFNEDFTLKQLSKYLPAQAPLKDFVHHNTLHAFQERTFFDALRQSSVTFGNRTSISLSEYRAKFKRKEISEQLIDGIILKIKPTEEFEKWKSLMFEFQEPKQLDIRIGKLRNTWKQDYGVDMDGMVRPKVIKYVNSFLDQNIAFESVPGAAMGFLESIENIQENSYLKIFSSSRAINLLSAKNKSLQHVLELVVGNEDYYFQYLFDQQFSHPGLSGMVCSVESHSESMFVQKKVTLFELIYFELLLELDALEKYVNRNFKPLAIGYPIDPINLFEDEPTSEYWQVIELWQEAFEFSYHDQVLAAISRTNKLENRQITSQAFFCIDDREESIRRNIEFVDPGCQTFGTPGHFSIIAKFQPEGSNFTTQVCPGPFNPKHVIKEKNRTQITKKDIHFQSGTHKVFGGYLLSQTLGFLSSLKLLLHLFNPKESAAQYDARHDHMDYHSNLIFEYSGENEEGLQVGFTVEEMSDMVFQELSNTGLTKNFASIVYFFGHGGSSTNNPYFAGYNCGACSGRPGTVNARLIALMVNRPDVRENLLKKGLAIPSSTHFMGGYHDTTKDTFAYFDEDKLPSNLAQEHNENKISFTRGLHLNAKERARQFQLIDIKRKPKKVHSSVIKRSMSLFEPRPEYNHSNNSLFIIGNRTLTSNLFLDQRAFLNSYDYQSDPDGHFLTHILNAGTGVCGGINLEYYFSTVDNAKLGAGSKLPQNVIGLYGVANGVKGDLRPGLPWQMIDVHQPIRILTIIENTPEIILQVLKENPTTYAWYLKSWMKLAAIDPKTKTISLFHDGEFKPYIPLENNIERAENIESIWESTTDPLNVYALN